MSNVASPLRTVQHHFAAGELDPMFRMRTETDAMRGGARIVQNMFVKASGGASRRPGTTCLAKLPDRARLIEFEVDQDEKYVCAFRDNGLEIYDKYGTLVDSFSTRVGDVPWEGLDNDFWQMSVVQKADVMIICHTTFQMTRLRRTGLNKFVLEKLNFSTDADGGAMNQPYIKYYPNEYTLAISDVTVGTGRTVTCSHNIFHNGWIGERLRIHNKEMKITSIVDSNRVKVQVFQKVEVELGIAPISFTEGNNLWVVEHPLHGLETGAVVTLTGAITSAGINQRNINGPHTVYVRDEDHYACVSGTENENQHAEFSLEGGGSNIRVSTTYPTQRWVEQVWSPRRFWPSACALHENRLWFGGSRGNPTFLAGSAVGQYYDFNIRDGLDTDSIQGNIASTSRIRWLVSSKVLQIFTDDAEAAVDSAAGEPITPANFRAIIQTHYGTSNLGTPRVFDGATVFIQRNRKNIRELLYDYASDSHASTPISMPANHLFTTSYEIACLDGTGDRPEQYAFIVNNSNILAVLHSIRSEKMLAWTRFVPGIRPNGAPTAALPGGPAYAIPRVDAVCVMGQEVYFSVLRDGKYFLERLELYPLDTNQPGFTGVKNPPVWLDCAKVFHYHGVQSQFQLDNINGQYRNTFVHVMSEGSLWAGRVYSDNSSIVRLPKKVKGPVVIGFDYEVKLIPNPPELDNQMNDGPMTGQTRRIVSSQIHLDATVSCQVNGLDIVGYEGNLPLTQRPSFTGKRKIRHLGYDVDPTIAITQNQPGALTVLGIVHEVSL